MLYYIFNGTRNPKKRQFEKRAGRVATAMLIVGYEDGDKLLSSDRKVGEIFESCGRQNARENEKNISARAR